MSGRTNPRYYRLIREFEALTGVPVLLNTSFNENEPIVDTPEQALDCFLRTRMDVIVVNNTIIQRRAAERSSRRGKLTQREAHWPTQSRGDNLHLRSQLRRLRPQRLRISIPTYKMLRTIRLVLVAGAMGAAVDVHAQTAPPADPRMGLNSGDQIRIAVWRNPEFTGDFMIAADGTITHPLYREIQVAGIPMAAVEERLRTFLTRYIANPQFVIMPLVKIIVAGAVRSPNVFSVPPETTIAQAIVLAGGATDQGRLDRVRVIREGREIGVDLTKADSDVAMLQIRSGDQILVARRTNVFRDVVAPVLSGVAAVAAVAGIFVR